MRDFSIQEAIDIINSLDNTSEIRTTNHDKNGIPCAFEFLNASKLFGFDKSSLMNIKKINITINVTSKLIELNTLIVVLVHNKAVSNSLQKSHVNNVNIPELNLAFV